MFEKTKKWLLFLLCNTISANVLLCQIQIKDSSVNADLNLFLIALGEDTRLVIMPICKKPADGVWFVHVHEDEFTAVDAALSFMDSVNKGCFVTLQHGMGRNISFNLENAKYTFDPNRIFTLEGRIATLNKFGAYSDSAQEILAGLSAFFTKKFIDSNRLIVALHNNTNEGGLTINSYEKGGLYEKDAFKVYVNKKEDADDFFYTTSPLGFNFLKKRGFNVMLQNNETVADDGSLSVYAGLHGIDYINIEAEHGNLLQQKRMLGAIMDYIALYYPSSKE